jgi:hypothetical protein
MAIELVTCDPGKDATGLAAFDVHGRLVKAELWRPDDNWDDVTSDRLKAFCGTAARFIVELPKGRGSKDVKKINSLIQLAFFAGLFAGSSGCTVGWLHPHEWKGQRPKEVDNRYTLSILSEEEREMVKRVKCPESLRHNMIDAIGIGLWKVGRR